MRCAHATSCAFPNPCTASAEQARARFCGARYLGMQKTNCRLDRPGLYDRYDRRSAVVWRLSLVSAGTPLVSAATVVPTNILQVVIVKAEGPGEPWEHQCTVWHAEHAGGYLAPAP